MLVPFVIKVDMQGAGWIGLYIWGGWLAPLFVLLSSFAEKQALLTRSICQVLQCCLGMALVDRWNVFPNGG